MGCCWREGAAETWGGAAKTHLSLARSLRRWSDKDPPFTLDSIPQIIRSENEFTLVSRSTPNKTYWTGNEQSEPHPLLFAETEDGLRRIDFKACVGAREAIFCYRC